MDMNEIIGLNDDELQEKLEDAHREVFNLRFRAVTRQLANTSEVRKARKSVAQILTVIRARQLAAAPAEEPS